MSEVITRFTGRFNFLSNFWRCYVAYEGIVYPSAEHAYQAAKSLNVMERRRIVQLVSAGAAKKAGRNLTLRDDWNDVKLNVMRDVLFNKFQDSVLRERLIATGDRKLVEGNTWGDKYWGVCNEEGENHLGRLLMELRDSFRVTHKGGK